jgi:hypothetical protein
MHALISLPDKTMHSHAADRALTSGHAEERTPEEPMIPSVALARRRVK